MKMLYTGVVFAGFLCLNFGNAQQSAATQAGQSQAVANSVVQGGTPAQQAIDSAKRQLLTHPKKVQLFSDLALAYIKRAREAADPQYLGDAEEALARGVSVDPKDFQLRKTQVALLLARHDYGKAKELATALNRQTPDDVMIYGFLAEADIALGNYDDAEKSAQWMMNMLRNNVPGLMIGARLRWLYGDPEGAVDFLKLAYSETSPAEVEEQAWIANQIATVQIDSGKTSEAVQTLAQATDLFPNYAYTLENLARIRLAQNKPSEAVELLVKARQIDRDPDVINQLAEAEKADGQSSKSEATYAEFEKLCMDKSKASEDAIRGLILKYAGDKATAARALSIAQSEVEKRHDVWTLDAYAWALYANGRYQEAETAIQKVLSVGIQSAQTFDHAGHIAHQLGSTADAAKYFRMAIQANPMSEFSADASASLGLPEKTQQTASITSPRGAARENDLEANPTQGDDRRRDVGRGSPLATRHDSSPEALAEFSPVSADLLVPAPTETNRRIRDAQTRVAANPTDARGFAALGEAHYQRARETGDVNDFELAEQSLNKALEIKSDDFAADAPLAAMAEVYMGEHRFADAVTFTQKALALGSGDISPFAILGDAYADMGEYEKASRAYDHLTPLDMVLSPHAAYARDSRIAYLKFISGDTPKAIALMKTAVGEGLEARLPSENLAWLYFELGEFYAQNGDIAAADSSYFMALRTHPGDYRALAALGKIRGNQGRYAEGILLYQKAIAIVPMPTFVAELGDLYAKSGNQPEAKKQYQLVEYIGLLGHVNQVLHNRDLALFYADHDIKLAESLELAHKEFEVRRDIYTWDALAWALYKNGKLADAANASEKALQFGTQDSLLLYHSGVIATAMGEKEKGRDSLRAALQINPHFHLLYADSARRKLEVLNVQAAANVKEDLDAR